MAGIAHADRPDRGPGQQRYTDELPCGQARVALGLHARPGVGRWGCVEIRNILVTLRPPYQQRSVDGEGGFDVETGTVTAHVVSAVDLADREDGEKNADRRSVTLEKIAEAGISGRRLVLGQPPDDPYPIHALAEPLKTLGQEIDHGLQIRWLDLPARDTPRGAGGRFLARLLHGRK